MRTRRKLVDQGLPWLRKLCLAISCHSRIVGAMTAPTEDTPQPVAAWPAWSWWREPVDGHPRAGYGLLRVQAHNDMVLMARIRRAEGTTMDERIAELERLFPDSGWVFGSVCQSVATGSGAAASNLTARKGIMLLAGATVPELAEKIRHEEGITG